MHQKLSDLFGLNHLLYLVSLCLFLSCGPRDAQIVDTSESVTRSKLQNKAAESECVAITPCKPIRMESRVEGISSGVLRGTVGQELIWKIQGYDADYKAKDENIKRRTVAVLLNRLPQKAKVSPEPKKSPLSQLVTIKWTPDVAQEAWIEIILRDMDRCLAIEVDANTCQKYVLLSDYDTRQQAVPWLISTGGGDLPTSASNLPVASPKK